METSIQAIYIDHVSLLSTTLSEKNLHIHAGLMQLMDQGINME